MNSVNIQYVRLSEDICGTLNDMARDSRKTVSDVVNEILREHLRRGREARAEGEAGERPAKT